MTAVTTAALPPDWSYQKCQPLLDALGATIPEDLLINALCHRSYAFEHPGIPHNERLEFLGDSVLSISVTEQLYTQYDTCSEGQLAKMRANIVSGYSLARIARTLGPHGLGEFLLLGRGENITGGRDKDSILADATEALFGALHLTHGIEVSREVILRLMQPLIDSAGTAGFSLDWKTSLQEYVAANNLPAPSYYLTSAGPAHAKVFYATGVVDGRAYGTGQGNNKKQAEQAAAHSTWDALHAGEEGVPISSRIQQALYGMPVHDINLDVDPSMPQYATE